MSLGFAAGSFGFNYDYGRTNSCLSFRVVLYTMFYFLGLFHMVTRGVCEAVLMPMD